MQGAFTIEAVERGDAAALSAVVEAYLPAVWRVLISGFTAGTGRAIGGDDLEAVEATATSVFATVFAPTTRRALGSAEKLEASLIAALIELGRRDAERTGRWVSGAEPGAADLAAARSFAELPARAAPSAALLARRTAARPAVAAFVGEQPDTSRRIVDGRFRGGRSVPEVAAELGCGVAAIREREGRLRRKLRRALGRAGLDAPSGAAELDLWLADASPELPARPTADRVARGACTRTHVEEPKPWGARAGVAFGFAGLAGLLYLLVVLGVLPGPAHDRLPEPALELVCRPACAAGAQVSISVRAPRDARFVAVVAGEPSRPVAVDPRGRSLSLPVGARERVVPLLDVSLAGTAAGERWTALFSKLELRPDEIAHRRSTRTVVVEVDATPAAGVGSAP